MGLSSSTPSHGSCAQPDPVFRPIPDQYSSLEEVTHALRRAGLESSQLIVGIDFTKSNEWTGRYSFGGRSLHAISSTPNPYEQAVSIIGRTLEHFDDDRLIPSFGFGDAATQDMSVFSLREDGQPCRGFQEVLAQYRRVAPLINMAGPTSFAPLIHKALDIVEASGYSYHLLLIVADGQVTRPMDTPAGALSVQEQATVDAIVAASDYPLSIVVVGVGDGPFDAMREFDDGLPARRFDNFQFVELSRALQSRHAHPDVAFALQALMEIPAQFSAISRLRLMARTRTAPARRFRNVPARPPALDYSRAAPAAAAAAAAAASSYHTAAASTAYPAVPVPGSVACPKCTLLCSPGQAHCSMCGAQLPAGAAAYAPSAPSAPPSAPPVSPAVPAPAASAAGGSEEANTCGVCMERTKDMVLGCGHRFCHVCAEAVSTCPVCRTAVAHRIRLFD